MNVPVNTYLVEFVVYVHKLQKNMTGECLMEWNPKKLTRFIAVPLWLAERNELSWGSKVVYSELVFLLDEDKGYAHASQSHIGQLLGLSRQMVNKYVSELKDSGLIEVKLDSWGKANYSFPRPSWFHPPDTPSVTPLTPGVDKVSTRGVTLDIENKNENKTADALCPDRAVKVLGTSGGTSRKLNGYDKGKELYQGLLNVGMPKRDLDIEWCSRLAVQYDPNELLQMFLNDKEILLSKQAPMKYLVWLAGNKKRSAPDPLNPTEKVITEEEYEKKYNVRFVDVNGSRVPVPNA